MTALDIAKIIPAEYRREILETNMITNAQSIAANTAMHYLATVWKNYIAPTEDLSCGACLERILNNWRQLQPVLIELEKQSRLLDGV